MVELAPHQGALKIVRRYPRGVSLDFMAYLMGREPTEVNGFVSRLTEEGVFKVEEGKVFLAQPPKTFRERIRSFWRT